MGRSHEDKVVTIEEENAGQIHSAAFTSDGRQFAVGTYNGVLLLLDTVKREIVATLRQAAPVSSLSFSPDDATLASASEHGIVLLWDVAGLITPKPPVADFDGDGTVGFPDFLLFAGAWGLGRGDAGYDARFDLDGNGTIGFSDFLIFAESFGQGG